MKKLIAVDEYFERMPEGCMLIPPVPWETLRDVYDVDFTSKKHHQEQLYPVELRVKDHDPVTKMARFMWFPAKTGCHYACYLQDTQRHEFGDWMRQSWAEIWA